MLDVTFKLSGSICSIIYELSLLYNTLDQKTLEQVEVEC